MPYVCLGSPLGLAAHVRALRRKACTSTFPYWPESDRGAADTEPPRSATARALPRRLARRGDHGKGESGQNSAMWLPPPRCTVTAQLQTAASRGSIVFASSSLKPVPKRIAVVLVYASKGFVTRQLAAHIGERDATIAVARA